MVRNILDSMSDNNKDRVDMMSPGLALRPMDVTECDSIQYLM